MKNSQVIDGAEDPVYNVFSDEVQPAGCLVYSKMPAAT